MTRHHVFRRPTGLLGVSDTDRNPEFWSTDRLIAMLDIGYPQQERLLTILATKDDVAARSFLRSLAMEKNNAGTTRN